MIDVTTEILIERPKKIVAEYASDPDNAPEWCRNIKAVISEGKKPFDLESKY